MLLLLFCTLLLNRLATILSCRPGNTSGMCWTQDMHISVAVQQEVSWCGCEFFVTGELKWRNSKDPFNFQRYSCHLLFSIWELSCCIEKLFKKRHFEAGRWYSFQVITLVLKTKSRVTFWSNFLKQLVLLRWKKFDNFYFLVYMTKFSWILCEKFICWKTFA